MTEAEVKALQEKANKASNLQTNINKTREKIKKINFEISTQQDGSGQLNIRLHTFPVVPYEKFYGTDGVFYGTDEVTDQEIISLGEFMIDALNKRIERWQAELDKI